MFRKLITLAAAFLAAATTTLTLFSAVASHADRDRALLLAARRSSALTAAN
ncbi:MAG TPA: hypothetical protein PKV98_18880 [Burkholderiaceae bacterium]|nr:hypothetical protein [Burkholderiaceae bacterium]